MSNKKSTETQEKELDFKTKSFGIAKDANGHWHHVVVGFDLASGQAKILSSSNEGNKGAAVERFKITVGQSDMLD